MVNRLQDLSQNNSFFLFGARGTGKTTLLAHQNFFSEKTIWIDLLEPEVEERYSMNPQLLYDELKLRKDIDWVVIDEIQKSPKLLDVVHKVIESSTIKFVLTGSSSRKLKQLGSNLLAGRAFMFHLFPFTYKELGHKFNLNEALNWGTLPKIHHFSNEKDKALYLKSYLSNYIKEEIVAEQLVRNLNPFRLFLPLCMQSEGEPLNFSKISESTHVDIKTVQNYFEILIDTHLGFFLNSYDKSVRVVQKSAPKFYFFDNGVRRAIEKQLTLNVEPQTSQYGKLFESWFINECFRYNDYYQLDYSFSYLRTKDDAEIDLIIEKPNGQMILVEIKSATQIEERHLKHLKHFRKDFPDAQLICVSNEKKSRLADHVLILNWSEAFVELGLWPT